MMKRMRHALLFGAAMMLSAVALASTAAPPAAQSPVMLAHVANEAQPTRATSQDLDRHQAPVGLPSSAPGLEPGTRLCTLPTESERSAATLGMTLIGTSAEMQGSIRQPVSHPEHIANA